MSDEARGQIDRVIENRYRARLRAGEAERPEEAVYAALSRGREEDLRAQHREAWRMHHSRMAILHEDLAEEHRREARALGNPLPEVESAAVGGEGVR